MGPYTKADLESVKKELKGLPAIHKRWIAEIKKSKWTTPQQKQKEIEKLKQTHEMHKKSLTILKNNIENYLKKKK